MEASSEQNPSEVLRWMEVPGQPNVFALGNFARQVTFASQQTRAFNLIWALFSTNRLTPGQHVAVVGAGLAGITAAVAALAKGCRVDLYEQASQPCPLQRGNDIRFIHPNVLSWPDSGSDKAQTDFPFLNWTASTVRGVIKQIDLQWSRLADNNPLLNRYFGFKVNRLYASSSKSGPQRPSLSANRVVELSADGDWRAGADTKGNEGKKKEEKKKKDRATAGYIECAYDCIILALGFGEERSVAGVPFLSYWENDSLHQENSRGRRSILVSGCGDGGLIDALRLRLRNFDHAQFVRDFLNVGTSGDLVQQLKKADEELLRYGGSPDISLKFQDRYDEITVPDNIERHFREGKRGDTTVTLNSPAPGPLSFRASLLNRYATYLAMRFADLHYLSGRIVAERAGEGNFQITLEQDGTGLRETKLFDLVIVRHGPQSIIRNLIPPPALAELEDWWQKNQDITTRPHWYDQQSEKRHRFWGTESNTAPRPEQIIDLALTTFDSAYRELKRKDPEVQSVAVGQVGGKSGFFVTLKPGARRRETDLYGKYASVPVYYTQPGDTHPPTPEPEQAAQTREPTAQRLVQVGAGIYNYDARERLTRRSAGAPAQPEASDTAEARPEAQGVSPAGAGTLGCFAVDAKGRYYLLTTTNVLVVEGVSQKDDKVFLEGQGPATHRPIARLANFMDIRKDNGQSAETVSSVDVAAALLEPDVQPDFSMPTPWQIKGVESPDVGDKVAKMGRTSGLTTGRVIEVNVTFPVITSSSGSVWLSGIVIVGDDGQEFSMAGDGGAVIVREDGAAVGLLSAGSPGGQDMPGLTLACSLLDALRALNLELLLPGTLKHGSSKKPQGRRGRQKTEGGG